jgi:pimeloyl-ACP methyl ester carboxylesterase
VAVREEGGVAEQPVGGWVDGSGVRLHYREWVGPAAPVEPPLLLLHGLASASRIWDLVAPRLAARRRVVALDQRGHGLSDKPDDGYDFATIVADDAAALRALGLARPVVVGHSWGASVAVALAAAHPAQVAGVVLVDGGVTSFRDQPDWTWERVARELAPPDYAGTPRGRFIAGLRAGGFADFWQPALEEIILNIVELRPDGTVGPRLARANHLRILRAMWDEPVTDRLAALRCPVLAVLAEGPAGNARAAAWLEGKRRGAARLTERLPGATVRWLADTVHDVPLHRPAELAAMIEAFAAARAAGATGS